MVRLLTDRYADGTDLGWEGMKRLDLILTNKQTNKQENNNMLLYVTMFYIQ